MRTRTIFAWLALLPVLASPVAAPAVAQQDSDQPVRIAMNGFENNLTPFTITFAAAPNTHDLISLVYDTLFWSQSREEPEPWLAESAEANDDFTEWTVTLREGVTWHDGRPFTADDVKFSFEYYEAQEGASGRYAHHVSDTPPFESAEVVDERTVRLNYSAPAPQFEIMPGADLPILPKHVWEGVDDPKTQNTGLPVGSGPYKLVKIVPDQLYRFEANEDYFKGKPTVGVLELPIVKDPSAAFAALRTGEVAHVARNVPAELVDQFRGNGDIEILESTRFESTQMFFNARKAPLDDPRLRKAIAMGIDREALVQTVLLGQGRPGRPTFLHPDSPWAAADAEQDHDAEAARALLDQAGYTAAAGGVRKAPGGQPLAFTLLVSSFEPQDIRAGQLMGQQLAPLGVTLKVEALDPATLRQRRQAKPGTVPGYDAYLSTLEAHGHVDPDALYYFFHSPGKKGFGAAISGYSNPRFDAIVEEAAGARNDERKELLGKAQEILAEEAPAVVLWYRDGTWAYRPASYNGWVADPGQGIFTKRSFLPEYVEAARAGRGDSVDGTNVAARQDAGDGVSPLVIGGVLAAVAVGVAGLFALSRRRRLADDEDD